MPLGSSSPRSRGPRVDQGDGNDEDEAQIAEHDRARPSFVRVAVIGSEVLSSAGAEQERGRSRREGRRNAGDRKT